jgi:ribose transport system substrate-binding protein
MEDGMKRNKILFVVLAMLLVSAVSLSFAGTKEKEAGKKEKFNVAFSNVWEGNTWGVQSKAEFYAEVDRQKAAGLLDRIYYANAEFNAEKQVSDLEDLFTKDIDILIIQPVNPPAVSSVIEKFYNRGTIIIPCVSPLETKKYTASLMSDDREFGQKGAKFLVDALGGKGNIVALDGMDGITVAINRWAGAKSVFDQYPDIKILAKTFADWDYAKGKAATENFLAAFPNIDGVWASGGAMTQGAIEAFIEAGRPLVPMSGEDNNGFLKLWKKYKGRDKFKAIGCSMPTYFFAEGLKLGLDIARGKQVPGDTIPKDQILHVYTITEDNLDKYVRPDLPDSFWANTHMNEEQIKNLFPGE